MKNRPSIIVTENDIEYGIPRVGDSCPIALAIKRRLGVKKVNVDGYSMRIEKCEYRIPKSARKFIDKFDDRKKVKPFRFKLPMAMEDGFKVDVLKS